MLCASQLVGGDFFLACEDFWRIFDRSVPASALKKIFFFEVKISSRTLTSLFIPGSVHSGSARWDDCGRMFSEKLLMSSFLQLVSNWILTHCERHRVTSGHSRLGVKKWQIYFSRFVSFDKFLPRRRIWFGTRLSVANELHHCKNEAGAINNCAVFKGLHMTPCLSHCGLILA